MENNEKEKVALGKCPRCGKAVYETPKTYKCENPDCNFIIWKENYFFDAIGYKAKAEDIEALLKGGKFLATGLTSKKGNKYDAYLSLEDDENQVRFKMEFPERTEPQKKGNPVGKCPRCGKDVYETPKSYRCEDNECGWTFWKDNRLLQSIEFHMTKPKIKMLLQEGRVYSDQLKSKKGTRFSAWIKLTDDGERTGVELEFANQRKGEGDH